MADVLVIAAIIVLAVFWGIWVWKHDGEDE